MKISFESTCKTLEIVLGTIVVLGLETTFVVFNLYSCAGSQLQHAGPFSCGMWDFFSLVVPCELFDEACGVKFPDQGLDPGLLPWQSGVLATGPLGKSLDTF